MRKWWADNWFPVAFVVLLGTGMLLIGFRNGWS